MRTVTLVAIVIALNTACLFAASPIVGWRTDGTGAYPAAKPVDTWSETDNVLWRAPMPARSNATPVILGDRIFTTYEPAGLVCVDRKTGDILWQQANDDADLQPEGRIKTHRTNGYASCTPVTDGQRVFAVYGTGLVVACTVDGKRLWARIVEQPKHGWGHSASPMIADGKLIVHIRDLVALDPQTGKELWRTPSKVKWGTPAVANIDGKDLLLTPSGDAVRASDGEILARNMGGLAYATPVIHDRVAYYVENNATAFELPKSIDQPFTPKKLWSAKVKGSRHYASALYLDGRLYAASREGFFAVLNAKTGELLHESRLDFAQGVNSIYPSVTQIGPRFYISSERGTTAIYEPGDNPKQIGTCQLDPFRGTPVAQGNDIYIRSQKNLYRIGPK